MTLRTLSSLLLLPLSWAALSASSPLRASQDSPLLDGTWRVTSVEGHGKGPDEPPLLLIGNGAMVLDSGSRLEPNTFLLGPGSTINIVSDGDQQAPGIYELEGDSLKLCFAFDKGAARPTTFAGGKGVALMTMTRVPNVAGANARRELQMLQGSWRPIASTKWNGAGSEAKLGEVRFVFENARLNIQAPGDDHSAAVILDLTTTPHRMALAPQGKKENPHILIYAWENGRLKIGSGKGKSVPANFDDPNMDEVLTLAKAPRAIDLGVEDPELKPLQGAWNVVQAERDGHPGDKGGADMKLIIQGRNATLIKGSHKEAGVIRVDATANPKRLDMTMGEGKGEVAPFIYEVNGSQLKLCWRKPGGARPTEFSAAEGSSLMLLEKAP